MLIAGIAVLGWGITSYLDLKKAETEYSELPQDSSPGSSKPYPTDNLFLERFGAMAILLVTGAIFIMKWKLTRHTK